MSVRFYPQFFLETISTIKSTVISNKPRIFYSRRSEKSEHCDRLSRSKGVPQFWPKYFKGGQINSKLEKTSGEIRNDKFVVLLKPLLVVGILFCIVLFDACTKDTTIEGDDDPKIDALLVAPWYNRVDSIGFEVMKDGSTKTLTVDSIGKLQYMPLKDTVKRGTIILNILKTDQGDIHLKIVYRIPRFIDTTVAVVGQYSFSANNDTLKLIVPEPTTAKPTLVTYIRSFIGALVAPRP